jgi:Family of unknown function (DUF6788)
MSKQDKIQISATRQKIASIITTIEGLVEGIISSSMLTKGTICEKKRKCGNPKCRCARGELHVTKILSYSDKGKSRIIHLSKYSDMELSRLEKQVNNYQRFRTSRARIVNYCKLLIRELNVMERTILMDVASSGKGGKHE